MCIWVYVLVCVSIGVRIGVYVSIYTYKHIQTHTNTYKHVPSVRRSVTPRLRVCPVPGFNRYFRIE
jgi:hypothetical protein